MNSSTLAARMRAHWRALLVGLISGVVMTGLFAAIVLPTFLLTHRSEWPGERLVAGFALSMAAWLHAPSATTVPVTDRQALQRGRSAYIGSCAQCHGTKADGKDGILSATLFPPATDLTSEDAREKNDADLFWATKHGLSFTAMPAFGNQFNDATIREIVGYLRALQQGGPSTQSLVVPTPSAAQLIKADPLGDAVARGAAVYFAQNCQLCHGGSGDGPGDLRLRSVATNDATVACQIRNGPNGMPAYDVNLLSDQQMTQLIAFMRSILPAQPTRPGNTVPPGGPRPPGTAGPDRPPEQRGGEGEHYSSQAAASGTFAGCEGGRG